MVLSPQPTLRVRPADGCTGRVQRYPLGYRCGTTQAQEENMYKILDRVDYSDDVYVQVIEAPAIAVACQPGQFIILRIDEEGERIPLTIADFDREAGTITIIVQAIGKRSEERRVG